MTFFAPYGLFLGSPGTYESMSLGAKMALCLLPNCALYLGIQGIYSYEKVALGIGFGEIGDDFLGDELTMGYVWLMLCVDAILYGIITWYMDNVKPGPFGQARPFYFPFLVRLIANICTNMFLSA